MDGVVELPAEANPLTESMLYRVLQSAASSDPQQIQTGTKQLQRWETERGYYNLLQTVFIDKSLPVEVRYLAVIQLKNGIDKYWRKTATHAVSKEDRKIIRSRLLESGVDEDDRRLALQNALVIAKIVRFEYPNDWPDAVTSVTETLRSSTFDANRSRLSRVLLILLHIVKELATGRLIRTRANLQSVTPEIFHVLGRIYLEKVQKWQAILRGEGDDEGGALDDIEQSLLAIKILRRLLVAGYEFPNREKDVQEFWSIVGSQLGDFLGTVLQESATLAPQVQQLVEKHLVQLSKLHLEMAKAHPVAFVLLPDSIELVRSYWALVVKFGQTFGSKSPVTSAKIGTDGDADGEDKSAMERLSLRGLLLLRACLKMIFNPAQTFKYRHQQEKEEKAQATQLVRLQLFTDRLVGELMEVIVMRYFVFRASDLRDWEDAPEEWERREDCEGEDYEFAVRPCAEKLFLDLAVNYKEIVIQPLLNVFYSVASPDNDNVLFKDSVYTAIGLSAAVIHQQLDFGAFINSTLVAEVQRQQPGYNVLRRRIAILLAQWIPIKVPKPSRPLVYQIFQYLLDKSDPLNDQVVRLTAGRQFKNIADEWEFEAEQFMPYAAEILSRLMALIEEVELTETKMALLNTISVIVERLEHHITPYADRIVSILPPLWDQSEEEHLMKQAILTILARLINAMKAESRPFHSLVLPIIKGAVEPGSSTQLYLLEDALDLWSSIIIQTPAPAPEDLLSLAPYLLPTLSLGSDTLRTALEIAESYLLLSPPTVLSDTLRPQLISNLASLLGSLKSEANGVVTHLVQVIVRAADGVGGEAAVRVLVDDMLLSGFLVKLLNGLRGAWRAHQTTGPKSLEATVDGVVETDYFSVLARLVLASPQLFLGAVQSAKVNSMEQEGVEQTMKWLSEEWFSHFENIGDPSGRKLMCLALTRLLEAQPAQAWMLGKLQDLMTMWTDVVVELTEGNEDKSVDSLIYPALSPPSDQPEAPEDARRRALHNTDPVHMINTLEHIRRHLQQAIVDCGGQLRFQNEWLVNVDRDIVRGFAELGIL